jgi:hypothetical protein
MAVGLVAAQVRKSSLSFVAVAAVSVPESRMTYIAVMVLGELGLALIWLAQVVV